MVFQSLAWRMMAIENAGLMAKFDQRVRYGPGVELGAADVLRQILMDKMQDAHDYSLPAAGQTTVEIAH